MSRIAPGDVVGVDEVPEWNNLQSAAKFGVNMKRTPQLAPAFVQYDHIGVCDLSHATGCHAQ